MGVLPVLFLCLKIATFTVTTSLDLGSKPQLLHSHMQKMYTSRAQGNGNGSFTISLRRNQKILATSIRGFEPEKNETTWKGSTIEMKFRLGNCFKDEIVLEAELVVTSKRVTSRMSRRYKVSVYVEQSVLAPNDTRLVDSRAFPRRANVEFGLNVTHALKLWSYTSVKTHILQLKVEAHNGSKASLNVWRYFKHGHTHGPFLVLYTRSKHTHNNDDIRKMLTINWSALSSMPDNTTARMDGSDASSAELPGRSNGGRSPRTPSLTCNKVSFAITMQNFYSNIVVPQTAHLNYCDGYCYYPIQNHLTPTEHAIMWALVWKRQYPGTSTPKRPMCVPSKLGAQTVVFSDRETGQPVQKEWLDFSATECGCR